MGMIDFPIYISTEWKVGCRDCPRFGNNDLTERINFGILDHFVKLSSDAVIFVPMRVIKDGEGSEVIFTWFQTADMPDDKFAEDAKSVKKDLNILKN